MILSKVKFFIFTHNPQTVYPLKDILKSLEFKTPEIFTNIDELAALTETLEFCVVFLNLPKTETKKTGLQDIYKKIERHQNPKVSWIFILNEHIKNRTEITRHLKETENYIHLPFEKREIELAVHFNLYKKEMLTTVSDQNNFFRSLVNELPDIVYTIDNKGRFTFISDKISEYGYDSKELIGQHYKTIFEEEDYKNISRNEVLKTYKGKITGDTLAPKLFDERRTNERSTKNLEIKLKRGKTPSRKNNSEEQGKIIRARINASGVFSSENVGHKFVGSIGVIQGDFNHSDQFHNKQRKNTDDNSTDIVYKTDINGYFTYIGEEIKMFGYDPQELIGKHYSVLFKTESDDNKEKSTELFEDFTDFSDQERVKTKHVNIITKNNNIAEVGEISTFEDTTAWAEINAQGFYEDSGKTEHDRFSGSVGVIRNIAQRKQEESYKEQFNKGIEGKLKQIQENITKAQNIQKKLNTLTLPSSPKCNFFSLYMPSEQLSGDFIDIKKKDDRIYIILGDCTGHGIEAAMDATLLRAISDRHTWLLHQLKAPEIYLEHMNLDLMKYMKEDRFPTVFAAVVDIKSHQLTYANAQGMLPYIIRGQDVIHAEEVKGFWLGFDKDTRFTKNIISLHQGDELIFFSDALPELMTSNTQMLGQEGIKQILKKTGQGLAKDAKVILNDIEKYNGGLPLHDDLTMVLVELTSHIQRSFTIHKEEELNTIYERLDQDLKYFSYPDYQVEMIKIAAEEMGLNAVHHGNKNDPTKTTGIKYELDCQKIKIEIEDEGAGFDHNNPPKLPDTEKLIELLNANKEEEYSHGRGIWITKQYSDTLTYNAKGNRAVVEKKRDPLTTKFLFNEDDIEKQTFPEDEGDYIIWNQALNPQSVISSKAENIIIIIPSSYFVKSQDFMKIFKIIDAFKTKKQSIFFKIKNNDIRDVILQTNISNFKNITVS